VDDLSRPYTAAAAQSDSHTAPLYGCKKDGCKSTQAPYWRAGSTYPLLVCNVCCLTCWQTATARSAACGHHTSWLAWLT